MLSNISDDKGVVEVNSKIKHFTNHKKSCKLEFLVFFKDNLLIYLWKRSEYMYEASGDNGFEVLIKNGPADTLKA